MELTPHVVRYEGGKAVRGRSRLVFINNGTGYFISSIFIWQDGTIDCDERVDVEGFKQKVADGWVCTNVPDGSTVCISGFSIFRASDIKQVVSASELILEVQDMLDELNHRPSSSQRCQDAFKRYQIEPSEARRRDLRAAYVAVPEHLRRALLQDMDQGDTPILEVIAGLEVEGDPAEAVAMQDDPFVQKTIDFILSSVSSRQAETVRLEPGPDMVRVRFEQNGVANHQAYKREIHTGMTARLGRLVEATVYPLRKEIRTHLERDGVNLQVSFYPTVYGAEVIIARSDHKA